MTFSGGPIVIRLSLVEALPRITLVQLASALSGFEVADEKILQVFSRTLKGPEMVLVICATIVRGNSKFNMHASQRRIKGHQAHRNPVLRSGHLRPRSRSGTPLFTSFKLVRCELFLPVHCKKIADSIALLDFIAWSSLSGSKYGRSSCLLETSDLSFDWRRLRRLRRRICGTIWPPFRRPCWHCWQVFRSTSCSTTKASSLQWQNLGTVI